MIESPYAFLNIMNSSNRVFEAEKNLHYYIIKLESLKPFARNRLQVK